MFSESEDYKKESPYYTKSDLKSLGWTNGAIASFLSEPDTTAPNPYSRKASPVKLFSKDRVNQVMQSEPFTTWQSKTAPQRLKASDNMKELMAARQNALVDQIIKRLEIYWTDKETLETLVNSAMTRWEEQKIYRESQRRKEAPCEMDRIERPTWNSDINFLERITLNYIRHECSNYHELLRSLEEQVGRQAAYESLKNEIAERVEAKFGSLYVGIKKLKAIEQNLLPSDNS
ncbi:hypothetical protein [Coleofasciculus sp. FACHB-SPT9]|uniref:hypothetical protein n=1 Tax=Cyanophyceae TaxID=3028117 RepID=UPI001685646B|nr:hypothetical protein [Coleofasciculus sp. FACHB-SPT9]MBD1890502.1 hypothetical protein [Coleofasciculus sp. FACHB-SPT9]